jgi:hypothetical protein
MGEQICNKWKRGELTLNLRKSHQLSNTGKVKNVSDSLNFSLKSKYFVCAATVTPNLI